MKLMNLIDQLMDNKNKVSCIFYKQSLIIELHIIILTILIIQRYYPTYQM